MAPSGSSISGPRRTAARAVFVSGHVKKPGAYEASMRTTLRELIFNHAGGIRDGHKLKAVIPGGSSVPILLPDQLDIPASFDDVAKAGSMLGSAGIIVMDDTTCMVWAAQTLFTSTSTSRAASARRAVKAATGCTSLFENRPRRGGDARLHLLPQRVERHRRQDAVRLRRCRATPA